VPPANLPIWQHDDGGSTAEPAQRRHECRAERVGRRAAVAVQEDEQRPILAAALRRHQHLIQLLAEQLAP
jgi:hypothetical protein